MKLLKKISRQNIAELRGELSRAHLIISLLALICIMLLTLGSTFTVTLDNNLSTIASVFLGFLALTSLVISYFLFKRRR